MFGTLLVSGYFLEIANTQFNNATIEKKAITILNPVTIQTEWFRLFFISCRGSYKDSRVLLADSPSLPPFSHLALEKRLKSGIERDRLYWTKLLSCAVALRASLD